MAKIQGNVNELLMEKMGMLGPKPVEGENGVSAPAVEKVSVQKATEPSEPKVAESPATKSRAAEKKDQAKKAKPTAVTKQDKKGDEKELGETLFSVRGPASLRTRIDVVVAKRKLKELSGTGQGAGYNRNKFVLEAIEEKLARME